MKTKLLDFIKGSFSNKFLWIWLGFYFCISIFLYSFLKPLKVRPDYGASILSKLFGGLILFDASHYLTIAKQGYIDTNLSLPAFFPLYPMLVKIFSFLFRTLADTNLSIILAATLINIACIAFSLNILKRLIKLDFKTKTATYSQYILLLYPFSFFFLSMYTESIFLLAILSSFYAARKNKWLLACIIAALASAIRIPGLLLVPALLIEFLYQKNYDIKKVFPRALWLMIAPIGSILYLLYLQLFRRGFGKYFEAYRICWPDRRFEVIFIKPILLPIYNLIFIDHKIRPNDLLGLFSIALAGLIVYLLFKYKLRPSYIVFTILGFLLPLFTGTLESIGRYYVVIFPAIICLSIFFEKNRKLFPYYLIISTISSITLMMLFIRGVFVG